MILDIIIDYLRKKYTFLYFGKQSSPAIHNYNYIVLCPNTNSQYDMGMNYIFLAGEVCVDLIYKRYDNRPNQYVVETADPQFLQKIEAFINSKLKLKNHHDASLSEDGLAATNESKHY